jgi:hypothetical protein
MSRRIFGKNGPILQDKNIGRDYTKKGTASIYRPHQGSRETERRRRRLAAAADASPASATPLDRMLADAVAAGGDQ